MRRWVVEWLVRLFFRDMAWEARNRIRYELKRAVKDKE